MPDKTTPERVAVHFRILPDLMNRIDDCCRGPGITRPEAFRAAMRAWCERQEVVEARRKRLMKEWKGAR